MTIIGRVRLVAAVLLVALVPTAVAIVWLSNHASTFLAEMQVQRQVIEHATAVERAVIDAETGQRGYLISRLPAYQQEYQRADKRAVAAMAELVRLKQALPIRRREIDAVLGPAAGQLAMLRRLGSGNVEAARSLVATQEGRFETEQLRSAVLNLTNEQRQVLDEDGQSLALLLNVSQWFALAGIGTGAVAVLALLFLLTGSLRRSLLPLLAAMRTRDASGIPDDVTGEMIGEVKDVAKAYNAMCERMRQAMERREDAERRISELLDHADHELAGRQHTSAILARISNRLPACLDQRELVTLATRFIPQLFDIGGGALYFLNNSSTVLSRVAQWGECTSSAPEFAPTRCWALRRGQQHHVADVSTDVTCDHLTADALNGYVCLPLIAQGETVGLLYLEESAATAARSDARPALDDMHVLCENLALALVNLRLRESLRHQSLRDPLTGLHNRRYLDETIELEFAKSRRSKQPVSVIMADIDHFKHVNDHYGHDIGDLVLRGVAETLGANIRKGDIACRFGGEEFVLLLPGLTHGEAVERAQLVRDQIRLLQLHSDGKDLPQVTSSFGVATFTGDETTAEDVLREADQALYGAKRAGRDRVHSGTTTDSEAATPQLTASLASDHSDQAMEMHA
jgi:diguanylate cyclase (GGDEF)-like protein